MLKENDIFSIHEADRQLFVYGRGGQFAKLTPDILEQKLSTQVPSVLHVHCLTQDGLELLAARCGSSCRVLYLDDCRFIRDFSPLENFVRLEAVRIEGCKAEDFLWNLGRNPSLKVLSIHGARKVVREPLFLRTSSTLEEIRLWGGGIDSKHVLNSLSCFDGMKSLRRIDLNNIKLQNHALDVLYSLPNLEEFHFDAGMLTTEEIAWICAKFPHLHGDCLRAYTGNDASCINDVRICGARKPGLDLPKDRERLEKYTAQFNALVEKYRSDSE